mmetsp:Transcript_18138/g.36790  ORF Transcript_18138/g.36790 Transcript_18138/m.36790 type:complete len:522 (-) Transcript_18138:208-1773(-)
MPLCFLTSRVSLLYFFALFSFHLQSECLILQQPGFVPLPLKSSSLRLHSTKRRQLGFSSRCLCGVSTVSLLMDGEDEGNAGRGEAEGGLDMMEGLSSEEGMGESEEEDSSSEEDSEGRDGEGGGTVGQHGDGEGLSSSSSAVAAAEAAAEGADRKRKTKSQKKAEKRALYKERRKANRATDRKKKREAQYEERRRFLASMTEAERRAYITEQRALKAAAEAEETAFLKEAQQNGTKIVVNCSFRHLMQDKEFSSLLKQLCMGRKFMKDQRVPLQFHFSSWKPNDPETEAVARRFGLHKWDATFHPDPYWDVFPLEDLVVLSPDAEAELEEVDSTKTYVIGGLVDRTVAKGQTASQAERVEGLQIRKLPIKSYVDSHMHPVLNVNTVLEILVMMLKTGDWGTALLQAVPARKQTLEGRKSRRLQRKAEARTAFEGGGEGGGAASASASSSSSSSSSSSFSLAGGFVSPPSSVTVTPSFFSVSSTSVEKRTEYPGSRLSRGRELETSAARLPLPTLTCRWSEG